MSAVLFTGQTADASSFRVRSRSKFCVPTRCINGGCARTSAGPQILHCLPMSTLWKLQGGDGTTCEWQVRAGFTAGPDARISTLSEIVSASSRSTRRGGCRSSCISARPSSAASSACHMRLAPDPSSAPSLSVSGHIGGWRYGVGRENVPARVCPNISGWLIQSARDLHVPSVISKRTGDWVLLCRIEARSLTAPAAKISVTLSDDQIVAV